MFKKIKAMAAGVANKIRGFVLAKETEIVAKAHTILDGTIAEAVFLMSYHTLLKTQLFLGASLHMRCHSQKSGLRMHSM